MNSVQRFAVANPFELYPAAISQLGQLRANTAERLTETLRSWLLHQGQRDAVAADLVVHAQTVRYRMSQLRELYGDKFNDPQTVLVPGSRSPGSNSKSGDLAESDLDLEWAG